MRTASPSRMAVIRTGTDLAAAFPSVVLCFAVNQFVEPGMCPAELGCGRFSRAQLLLSSAGLGFFTVLFGQD